jgi:uroporphyrinogen-III decarboxylase
MKANDELKKIEAFLFKIALEIAKEGEGALFVIGDNIKYSKLMKQKFENFSVFSKGAISSIPEITKLNCTTIGLDWNMSIAETRELVGETKTLQGNLDPCVLYGSESVVENETIKLLKSFKSQRHIVNLGHGVYPDIDPEKVKVFIKTVKNYEI